MRLSRALVALAATTAVLPFVPSASAGSGHVVITVLSSRADLVSAGDALVAVSVPAGARGLRVEAGVRDVTRAFAKRADGQVRGLVTGLPLGSTTLTATVADGRGARITLVDHAIGGPVFAGPQIQPWACAAGTHGKQCDAAPTYTYKYMPGGLNGTPGQAVGNQSPLQDYDPANPPPAPLIATTTTQTGVTVPFIVRSETGYLDRDQYSISALFQPGKKWDGTTPQPQFNHKLVLTHGASCDTEYETGTAPDTLNVAALGAGFVVASHALDNAGHNCNLAVQAEALAMTKERVIEQYGTLRYTIGSGCSGGSLVQQQVANAYPGIYQGISPQCSFTDAWSSAQQYVDYLMLLKYFQDPSRWTPGTTWDPVAISQVLGHPNVGNPVTFTTVIPNSSDPSRSCPGVPAGQVYDPAKNPKGVKCTLQDYMVNMFGKRPDGFANRGLGNVGIQYGLAGLRNGLISPAQFADLNAHLGGLDIKGDISKQRLAGDPVGLQRAYSTGAVDSANNLDKVAIIDLRGPDPGAFHDVYRTYALRARLMRDFGTAANQVLWRGQVPLLGDANYVDQAIFALDTWLDRVSKDDRSVPLAKKIIADKPSDIGERCTDGAGQSLPGEVCDETVAAYASPRIAAGGPLADDVLQCRLKQLRRDDYNVTFTSAQSAELKSAFPKGVCDYSQPGVGQRGATSWLTYQDAGGKVVYGGTPMGPPPVSTPFS
ncbi:MAG: N-acetylmuramoyl-L-alanine amidase [Frankiales bacterium]|nr:N-acetylmuramoyl-L-alanine amidase [Frankiales bacterium]